MANTLGSAGGFCAGTEEVVFHQRINGTAFVFSAALPAMLAVASSTAIKRLMSAPTILSTLRDNIQAVRAVLDPIESILVTSDAQSPLIHFQVRSNAEPHPAAPAGKATLAPPTPLVLGHDLSAAEQSRLLQLIVDDALEHGVLLVRHKTLPSINAKALESGVHARPSVRIAVSAGLSRKEMEKAAAVVKSSIVRVLGKRR